MIGTCNILHKKNEIKIIEKIKIKDNSKIKLPFKTLMVLKN